MQNVEKELPGLIKELLQAPAHKQRALIELHYTPDCCLTHPLVLAENREEIVRIFQYWRFANRRLDVEVQEIVVDKTGNKVWVQFIQHVTGFNHYLSPPLFSFSLPMAALLYLRDGPGGTKLIGKQVDYHSFEGILYTTPFLGWAMQHLFRRAITAFMLGSTRLGARVWPALEGWLRDALPGDGRAKVSALKASTARWWWRQAPPASRGLKVAPYDPHL